MNSLMKSCRVIRLIAGNTFLDAVRQKLFNILFFLSLGFVGSAHFFRQFDFNRSELKFIADFGFGTLLFFGSVISLVATAQLFFSEIEHRSALTILAKPVHRFEFIIGKFCGVFMVMFVFSMFMTTVLAAILYWRETSLIASIPEAFEKGRAVSYFGVYLTGLLQWIKFGILCAITIYISSFSSTNLYSVAVSFFVMLICQLQYLAHDNWGRIEFLPFRYAVLFLGKIFPNFQLFSIDNQVVAGEVIEAGIACRVILYGVVYILVFNALAVFSFKNREI